MLTRDLRLQPLHLLGPAALADVAGDAGDADHLAGSVADRRHGDLHVHARAVLALDDGLEVLDVLAGAEPREEVRHLVAAVGRDQHGARAAEDLLGRVAEEALGPAVPAEDRRRRARRPRSRRPRRRRARRAGSWPPRPPGAPSPRGRASARRTRSRGPSTPWTRAAGSGPRPRPARGRRAVPATARAPRPVASGAPRATASAPGSRPGRRSPAAGSHPAWARSAGSRRRAGGSRRPRAPTSRRGRRRGSRQVRRRRDPRAPRGRRTPWRSRAGPLPTRGRDEPGRAPWRRRRAGTRRRPAATPA